MTRCFTNAIIQGFRAIFGPRVTVTKSYTVREMTPSEQKAFDDAFEAMDLALAEMDKALDIIWEAKA